MSTPQLSFDRASYAGDPAGPELCAYCKTPIAEEYFRVGGNLACPKCADKAQGLTPPNGHRVFLHALSYGAIAAALGSITYAMLRITTGWTIGYAAIGVEYLIGWSMRKAAKQHGGRRYQWAAALLTYSAVSVAFIPVVWRADNEEKTRQRVVSQQTPGTNNKSVADESAVAKADWSAKGLAKAVMAVLLLFALGLVSPFMELTGSVGSGLLNLFIIFIGVRYAWMSMAPPRVDVEGPYFTETPA